MEFKIIITDDATQIQGIGLEADILKKLSLALTQYPAIGNLLRTALDLSDKMEKEAPELCADMREIAKKDSDVYLNESFKL